MTLCSRVVSTFNILFLTYQQMPLHHYMHRMQSFYTLHSATLRCISPSIAWFTSHTQVLLVACRYPLHSTCYCTSTSLNITLPLAYPLHFYTHPASSLLLATDTLSIHYYVAFLSLHTPLPRVYEYCKRNTNFVQMMLVECFCL